MACCFFPRHMSGDKDELQDRDDSLTVSSDDSASTTHYASSPIPGLPADIALSCLSILPSPLRMHLRGVCRTWRDECCGEGVNQLRFSKGLLMDASHLCHCPIKDMAQLGGRLKLKSRQNSPLRQQIITAYSKKLGTNKCESSGSNPDVPLDLGTFERKVLDCAVLLKKHLRSTNLATASIDDIAMYKLEMDRHKEIASNMRSLIESSETFETPSWKSLLKFPNSGVLNNDAIVFFMIA